MDKIVKLTSGQRELLTDLLRDYYDKVKSGDVTGYGQPMLDELGDINELLAVLKN